MLRYPILQTMLRPFQRSQQKTLALVIAAMAERAQATSVAVAGHLAVESGTQLGCVLTRFYPLLGRPRLDAQQRTAQLLQAFSSRHTPRRLGLTATDEKDRAL
jgi:hypothetical protein